MSDLGISFDLPFAQQAAALRMRLANLQPSEAWTDVWREAHDKAFMVAGATKADLLADLGAAIDRAVTDGTTLEMFRRDFRDIVARHGWTGWTGEGSAKGEAWRTRVIYQTNLLTSHAAGRYAQLIEGNYAWWVYRHSGSEHPRLHHLALDGLALPPDHPFWQTHFPPNGFGCGCKVFGARTAAGIRRHGGDPDKKLPAGWNARGPDGQLPGVGKGWDYAPGASVAGEITDMARALGDKLPHLPAAIGAAMFHGWPRRARSALAAEFEAFVDRSLSHRVEKNYMIIGALKPSWVAGAQAHGVTIASAEIAAVDVDIQHAYRGTGNVTATSTRTRVGLEKVEPLDLSWYRGLVDHLLVPDVVLLDLDQKTPAMLLFYGLDPDSETAKVVLKLNTPVKKAKRELNVVRSGRHVNVTDIVSQVRKGSIHVLEGKV